MDYYQLFGLDKDASQEEIAHAYRDLARKYHPDKNKASTAKEKYYIVDEAYKVLKDPKKREHYDRFDLPQVRVSRTESHNYQRTSHHRQKYDDKFFHGTSETYSEERRYQSELLRIQKKNSDFLEAANAKLRSSNSSGAKFSNKRPRKHKSGIFVGDIMPEKNDDEYEKIVLSRLRALGRQ